MWIAVLDEEILDLTIEVDEDKFEEEVLSADACALKAIAGVLRDRPTSVTGATQRLDPKTEAVPSTPGTSATQRVALKTETSPITCDDQVLDFEEGDQPDGPADISTRRERGQGKRPKSRATTRWRPTGEASEVAIEEVQWQANGMAASFGYLLLPLDLDHENPPHARQVQRKHRVQRRTIRWPTMKEVHPMRCKKKI